MTEIHILTPNYSGQSVTWKIQTYLTLLIAVSLASVDGELIQSVFQRQAYEQFIPC